MERINARDDAVMRVVCSASFISRDMRMRRDEDVDPRDGRIWREGDVVLGIACTEIRRESFNLIC